MDFIYESLFSVIKNYCYIFSGFLFTGNSCFISIYLSAHELFLVFLIINAVHSL